MLKLAGLVCAGTLALVGQAHTRAPSSVALGSGWEYGRAVSIHADTAAVGAPRDNPNGPGSGAVYILERDRGGAGRWGQSARLVPRAGAPGDGFGGALAIRGDWIAVGAPQAGAVYVFQRDERGGWREVQRLEPPGHAPERTASGFGRSVSLAPRGLLIGAPGLEAAFYYRCDPGDEDSERAGWFLSQRLRSPTPQPGAGFGSSVDLATDASGRDCAALVGAPGGGFAALYRRAGDGWEPVDALRPPAGDAAPGFGASVAIEADSAAVGATARGVYCFGRGADPDDPWEPSGPLIAGSGASLDLLGDRLLVGEAGGGARIYLRQGRGAGSGAWGWAPGARFSPPSNAHRDAAGRAAEVEGSVSLYARTAVLGLPRADLLFPNSGGALFFTTGAERPLDAPAAR